MDIRTAVKLKWQNMTHEDVGKIKEQVLALNHSIAWKPCVVK